MTQRQITLVNNSTAPTALALLQGDSVIWLAKYAYPGTQVRFTWDDTDYCFVWAGTGQVSRWRKHWVCAQVRQPRASAGSSAGAD